MTLDPNEFVDVEAAFADADETPDEGITHAGWTIVPGNDVDHARLVYHADGVLFLGRRGTQWAISLYYGYRYNGQDLPISEEAARHVLETLSGTTNLADYDWVGQNWTYFE